MDKPCSHGFSYQPFSNLCTTDIAQGLLNLLKNAHLHNLHFLPSSHHFRLNELCAHPCSLSSPPQASTPVHWQSPILLFLKMTRPNPQISQQETWSAAPITWQKGLWGLGGSGAPKANDQLLNHIIKHKRLPNRRRTKSTVTNLGNLHVFLYINIIPYISQYSNMTAREKGYCDSTNDSKGDLGFLWLA